jgi:hypothetical protein
MTSLLAMEVSAPAPDHSAPAGNSPRRWTRFLIWAGVALLLLTLATSGCALWRVHKLSETVDDLSFSITASDYARDNDLVTPDVGVIQFMRRGYSITFDTVNYGQNGLSVTGTLGNPTQMTLSALTLKLSARPYLYKIKDKLKDDPFYLYSGIEVGSGQTNIGYLGPGRTAAFSVTIPNVKQTSDGFQIVASFTGERYNY